MNEKIYKLFPEFSNKAELTNEADANGNTFTNANDLLKTVSDKFVSKCEKITAPINDLIVDVSTDTTSPKGNPVASVEVVEGASSATIDGHTFSGGTLQSKFVNVQLHKIATSAKVYDTDIIGGNGLETKLHAMMASVAEGVMTLFQTEADKLQSADVTAISADTVANLSGDMDNRVADKLILSPAQYAKLIARKQFDIEPSVEGALGWNQIARTTMYTGNDGYALAKGAIVGAGGYVDIESKYIGEYAKNVAIRHLGSVCGSIPCYAMFTFDQDTMSIKTVVFAWAGFAVADAELGKKIKL